MEGVGWSRSVSPPPLPVCSATCSETAQPPRLDDPQSEDQVSRIAYPEPAVNCAKSTACQSGRIPPQSPDSCDALVTGDNNGRLCRAPHYLASWGGAEGCSTCLIWESAEPVSSPPQTQSIRKCIFTSSLVPFVDISTSNF